MTFEPRKDPLGDICICEHIRAEHVWGFSLNPKGKCYYCTCSKFELKQEGFVQHD